MDFITSLLINSHRATNTMQPLIDVRTSHGATDDLNQTTQRKALYQLIYVQNQDVRVKVVETSSIQLEDVLTWLRKGNSIFITQKR